MHVIALPKNGLLTSGWLVDEVIQVQGHILQDSFQNCLLCGDQRHPLSHAWICDIPGPLAQPNLPCNC